MANHALVMTQAAWGGLDDNTVPTRYVFDEGHHVFDAADSAFSAALSGLETAELRRWLRGAEGGRSRARGLRRRIEELVADRPAAGGPAGRRVAGGPGAAGARLAERLADEGPELAGIEAGRPNPTEAVLRLMRRQLLARQPEGERGASPGARIECDLFPVNPELAQAAEAPGPRLWPHRRTADAGCANACSPGWTTRRRNWTPPPATASRRSAAPWCGGR